MPSSHFGVQKQYILDLIVSPGFYHPHMHISTEAIVEKQHQCNITVALYYIIARYYSRVESQHVCLTHIFSAKMRQNLHYHSSIALFFAKAQYEETVLQRNVESNTSNPISNFIS